jgi:uncharacterized membrane protein
LNKAASRIDLNAKIDWHLPVLFIHALTAGIALLLGPFQFIKSLRTRRPIIHRIIGRVYVGSVLLGGIFGFVLAIISIAPAATKIGFGLLAVTWLYSIYRAYTAILKRQIQSHRIWMIRNYSLTLAAITLRLWLPISMLLLKFPFEQAYGVAAWLSWIFPLVIAEWFIIQPALQTVKAKVTRQAELNQPEPEFV